MDLHTLADTAANVARIVWELRWWAVTLTATCGLIAICSTARTGGEHR